MSENTVNSNKADELCGQSFKAKTKISKLPEIRKVTPELRFDMEEVEENEDNFDTLDGKMSGGAIFGIVLAVCATIFAAGFIILRRNRSRQFNHIVMTNVE